MNNIKLLENTGDDVISINVREERESDEYGKIVFDRTLHEPIFIYDASTGKKIQDWSCSGNTILLNEQYKSIIIDYWYDYYNGGQTLCVGKQLTTGYFSLIGKMRVKDDVTGKIVTGIIRIPKLRLMSDLSMRLGSDAIPQVGRLDAVALPEGVRGKRRIMEVTFLNDDIDADM